MRYETHYNSELSIMNRELHEEEQELVSSMVIDMISAYRMSIRQAEGDVDAARSASATRAVK